MTIFEKTEDFSQRVAGTASALKMGMLLSGIPAEHVEDPRTLAWLKGVATNLENRLHQIDSLQKLCFGEDLGA